MSEGEDYLLIKYLNNELSEDESSLFNSMILSSHSLRETISLHRDIDEILGDKDLDEFEELVKKQPKMKTNRRISKVAAVILLIVLITPLVWFSKKTSDIDNNALYDSYFEAFPDTQTYRSDEVTDNGFYYYSVREYEKAILLLEKKENDGIVNFYLGISYMSIGEYESAMSNLNKAEKILPKTHVLSQYIKWYQCLLLLKMNKLDETKAQLNNIIEEDTKINNKAKRLLKALDT